MKDRLAAHKSVLLILIAICLIVSTGAVRLPSMSSDDAQSLHTYMSQTQETDLETSRENPRGDDVKRPASQSKAASTSDNIHEMELVVWPDFDTSGFNWELTLPNLFRNPASVDDYGKYGEVRNRKYPDQSYTEDEETGWYVTGCWINAPSMVDCKGGCFTVTIETSQVISNVAISGQLLPQNAKYQFKDNTTMWVANPDHVFNILDPNESLVYDVYESMGYLKDPPEIGEQWTSQDGSYTIKVCPSPNQKDGNKIRITVNTSPLDGHGKGGVCTKEITVNCEGCECLGYEPAVHPDGSTIARSGTLSMWVENDGLACPPYTWSVTAGGGGCAGGLTLSKTTTEADYEYNTLIASASADGYATVTATDTCGVSSSATVKVTGGTADWVFTQHANNSGGYGSDSSGYCGKAEDYIIVGLHRWKVFYWAYCKNLVDGGACSWVPVGAGFVDPPCGDCSPGGCGAGSTCTYCMPYHCDFWEWKCP